LVPIASRSSENETGEEIAAAIATDYQ